MGMFCSSAHFKSDDHAAALAAVRTVAKTTKGKAFLTPAKRAKGGWVSLFPDERFMSRSRTLDKMIRDCGVPHVLFCSVIDDDVLTLQLFENGNGADLFISCPDYFGECSKEELNAKGNAAAYAGMLNASDRKRLAKIIKPRLINGEPVGGEPPDFESERLAAIGDLLGIDGILGSYDDLAAGRRVPGIARPKSLIRVG